MTTSKGEVSRCGLCRFYAHQGRRGGMCERLSAPVAAKWESCVLSALPFEKDHPQPTAAIASTQKRWLVPQTASELVANPTVVNSTVHSNLAKEPQ